MLGRFLEFGVSVSPLAGALDFYRRLGFQAVPTGDTQTTPYAVVCAGELSLGLYEREPTPLIPTFVRPELASYVKAIQKRGVELDFTELADEQFHRAGFRDPAGHPVLLVEARTFSPADWNSGNVSACGDFLEYSVGCRSLDHSRAFWERLGFTGVAEGSEPHRWVRLAGHDLVLGLHESTLLATGLSFRATNLEGRIEYLRAKGFEPTRGTPLAPRRKRSATLPAPGDTLLYLLDEETS